MLSSDGLSQTDHWRDVMAGAPACLNLPFDRPRPAVQSGRTGRFGRPVHPLVSSAVLGLADRLGVTPFVVFETGLAITCCMLSASRDVVIGTVGQECSRSGEFSAFPLRHAIQDSSTPAELLVAGQRQHEAALRTDMPGVDKILAILDPPRRMSFAPLFQVFCQLRPQQPETLDSNAAISNGSVPLDAERSDLAVVYHQAADEFEVTVRYGSDVFDADTVEGLIELHDMLLAIMAEAPQEQIGRLWKRVLSQARSSVGTAAMACLVDAPRPETGSWYPMSSVQNDLWFAAQAGSADPTQASLAVLNCPVSVDLDRLENAMREEVAQTEAAWLRLSDTGFQGTGRGPTTDVTRIDIPFVPESSSLLDMILDWHRRRSHAGAVHSELALFTAPGSVVVAGSAAHLWHDGWSILQGFELICRNYATLGEDTRPRFAMDRMFLPTLRDEQLYRWSAENAEDISFWQQAFEDEAGTPLTVNLADRPHRAGMTQEVQSHRRPLPTALAEAIARLAKALSISQAELFTGLTAMYLARITGEEEVIISVPFLNRTRETLKIPGQFANALPVRMEMQADRPIDGLLVAASQAFRTALKHGRVPFGDIMRTTGLNPRHGDVSVNVLFHRRGLALEGQLAELRWLAAPESGLSFLFTQFGRSNPIELEARYNASVFDTDAVAAHTERLIAFAEEVVHRLATVPDQPLHAVPLVSEDERHALVSGFNDTDADYCREWTVVDLFEERAAARSDAMATVDGGRVLSYGELGAASSQLARYLIDQGIGPECVVGVCLERSQELIVALLAVLKTGAAYLPLDPDYPGDRLAFMLNDAQADAVVTVRDLGETLPEFPMQAVLLDDQETVAALATQPTGAIADTERLTPVTPDNLAYVLYTSGSTGTPKGVMISHASFANFLRAVREDVRLGGDDICLSLTAIGFDVSMQDFCLPLISGAQLVLADRRRLGEPGYMDRLVGAHGITFFETTPAVLTLLFNDGWRPKAEMKVICGSEILARDMLAELSATDARTWNSYGPTECAVTAVSWPTDAEAEIIPIGTPLGNVRIYVVDERLEPQPVGVAGELLIGGVQVGRGYLGRSGLTAEKFIADSFGNETGGRLYRTGDLARWRPDGTLEFLGRADFQIKIRGMRVEPGEIEARLTACDGIAQTVVVDRKDAHGNTHLVAYVVPEGVEGRRGPVELDGLLDFEAVRGTLRSNLPEHMVPAGFVGIARVPLTASGKVDRKALPEVDVSVQRATYAAPRSDEEKVVAKAVADLLAVDAAVGLQDSFFDLGGHSLLAVRLVARLAEATGRDLPVRCVFERPTVEGLAAALADLHVGGAEAIPQANRTARLPLSWQQERLWFLDRLDAEAGAAYHIEGAVRLKGALDRESLKAALAMVVDRHESLRTHFVEVDGRPVQAIRPCGAFAVDEEDVSGLDETAMEQRIYALLARPFDLSSGPLFRATLLRFGEADHILIAGGHHTVLDGWSLDLLLGEVAIFYSAQAGSEAAMPEPLALQYADYAAWQRTLLDADRLGEKAVYWRQQLSGVPDAMTLPFDRPRPKQADYRGGHVEVRVPGDVVDRLSALARSCDATLFMVLETAFALLLHRIGGDEDLVIGTAVGGRPRLELERLIGFFVNTVALRHRFKSGETFEDCLVRFRQTILDAFEHSDVPFEAVVEAVRPVRSLSHQPLVQVMFVLQNTGDAGGPDLDSAFEGLEVEVLGDDGRSDGQFELSLSLEEGADGIGGTLSYATQLFDAATARRIAAMYERMLSAIADDPQMAVAALPLISRQERQDLVASFNDTRTHYPRNRTVIDLFEEQVINRRDAVAVIDGNRDLSYGDLDAASNRLARHLIKQGIGPECVVGVCLERGQDLIVALLAIWKAGAAYLPLDPDYPRDRLAFMLDDAAANVVVTVRVFEDCLPAGVRLVLADDETTAVAALPTSIISDLERTAPLTPDSLAYVLYTSGSTGTPKGVMISHSSFANFLRAVRDDVILESDAVCLSLTAIGFDVSMQDFCLPLISGARLVLADRRRLGQPGLMAGLVEDYGITFLETTPAVLGLLFNDGWRPTEGMKVICGSEVLSRDLVADLMSAGAQTWNSYGPTECTVTAVSWAADPRAEVIPIGTPLSNVRTFVVDDRLELQPLGVAGELLIGGVQVGRGYLGRPGATADGFIADPFGTDPGGRLYRTGDLARRRADGTLEFLGRADFQVKIRGMRVELGEIEARLTTCDGIAQAVVVDRKDADGNTGLIAYVVPERLPDREVRETLDLEGLVDLEAVRGALRRSLPEHMVPSGFAGITRVPLTPSGKVDRKALPDVELSVQRATYLAPRSDSERAVAAAVKELLEVKTAVGVHDSFFDLGGHSLLAVRLVARLAEATGRDLPVRAVFERPTVEELAAALADMQAGEVEAIPLANRSAPLPLSWQQERLWFLDRLDTKAGAAYHLEGAVRLNGGLDATALKAALAIVVGRHESLRTHFAEADGRPVQVIAPHDGFAVGEEDLTGFDEPAIEQRVDALLSRPFDLSSGSLFRATLLRVGDTEHILVAGGHHSVLDGWSLDLLLGEVAAFYSARVDGETNEPEPLAVQYGDYAAWQRTLMDEDRLEEKAAYWRQQLAGVPDAITLPFDRPRLKQADYRGGQVEMSVPEDVAARLNALARSCDATLFMVLETAFAVLLHRLGGDEDLVIGTAVGGRPRLELEQLIGFFVNTVALRHRFGSDQTFEDCLGRNRQTILDAFEHSDVPFEAVVEAVQPTRSLSHQPLVQVMFVLQNTGDVGGRDLDAAFEGLEVEVLGDDGRSDGQFELSLSLEESADGIGGTLSYATQLFDAATARRIAVMYERVLRAIADDPRTVLAQLPLMSAVERRQLITGFNDTAADYPVNRTVVDLFEEQAAARPEVVAVIDGDRELTYRDLDAASNRLARHLITLGIGSESVVGLCMERSRELIVALLAIWKAGAAYLPLDPDYPRDRLAFMLDDAKVRTVIAAQGCEDLLPAGVQAIPLQDERVAETIAALSGVTIADADRRSPFTSETLAYVLYTSGSAGKPKGVMGRQRNLVHLSLGYIEAVDIEAGRRGAQRVSATWVTFLEEVLPMLVSGGTLAIYREKERFEADRFWSFIRDQNIDYLVTLPSIVGTAPDWLDFSDRSLVVTGERPRWNDLRTPAESARIWNSWGSTETAAVAGISDIICDSGDVFAFAPFGRAKVYVLDASLNVVPVSVPGELFVGGDAAALGYLGRPGLTADTFVADPFGAETGARLYRTGDLARWRPDGTLEFLGRADFQVKIRGMRVELGEIEVGLAACDGIAQAVVVARRDADGDTRLVAYVVPDGVEDKEGSFELEGVVDLEALRGALRRSLPEHMVPSSFVGIARVPLTSSGKVDRKALPDANVSATQRVGYAAPRTDEEKAVAEIMADLLDAETVGLHDGFFDLGGHSLLAVRLVTRLARMTGRDLPLRAVFEQPTVQGLAAALAQLGAGGVEVIPVADRSVPLPLSWQQERLWFLDRLDAQAGAAYHIEGALRLKGALDADALKAALSRVVERHESLRTHFAEADGRPVQVIADCDAFTVVEEDVSGLDETSLRKRVETLLSRPFDLSAGPLFRTTLLRAGEADHILVAGGHHTVLDGWSLDLLLGEVAAFYSADVRGGTAMHESIAVQYGDYAAWQRAALGPDRLEEKTAYWRQQLVGVPDAIALPFDRPRPKRADYSGGQVEVQVPGDVAERLTALARLRDATLFMVLETAFAALLHRIGGDEELVIGTAVGGRPRLELEQLIGFFVNTVALRHRFGSGETFVDCLGRNRQTILDAFEHSEVPFEAVVEAVRPVRSLSHQPLVQVMFVLQNTDDAGRRDLDAAFEGLDVEVLGDDGRSDGQFELSLNLEEGADGIGGTLSYATQLFDAATARRIAAMYERILGAIADDPQVAVAALPLISEKERQDLATGFNGTSNDYPRNRTVVDLFEQRVTERCDAVAVIDGDRELSYGDLDAASNRLARHLINQGIGPECVVGVCLERGQDLIVALLAIWKAGAAYLPLDPDYPCDRLAFTLDDAGANVVVTATDFQDVLPEGEVQMVLTDDDETDAVVAALPSIAVVDAERTAPLTTGNLAYAIYTSGSTGKPKGVMVEHGDLAHYASFSNDAFARLDRETVLHRTTIGFDYSAEELWWPLAFGHQVVVAPQAISSNPAALCRLCAERDVSTMIVVPSVLSALLSHGGLDQCRALQQILCGGEALDNRLKQSLLEQTDGIRLINHYGPTEATINATWHECTNGADDDGPVASIGSPVANTQIYVVDDRLEPTPLGVAGELLIGGVQVGRGYLGRSGLTADRYIADPFGTYPGSRLYRTGDLARWRPDGTLEFLGRADFQVKVRGMRVELGEIEAELTACDGIAQAVVVARTDAGGDARLIAYVAPEGVDDGQGSVGLEGLLDLEVVRSALRRKLPEHMVPSGFVGIARVPLTSSGKVDRKALPAADVSVQRAAYSAPRSEEEKVVAAAVAALLDVEEAVGLDDSFFDLGGHSLLAVRLAARLTEMSGRQLPLRAVFEQPTVAGLAAALSVGTDRPAGTVVPATRSGILPLSSVEERALTDGQYRAHVGDEEIQNFLIRKVIALEGPSNPSLIERTLAALVDRHEILRTHYEPGLENGGFRPVIGERGSFQLRVHSLPGCDRKDALQLVLEDVSKPPPVNVFGGPMVCASLFVVSEDLAFLTLCFFHISVDAVSTALLAGEFVQIYAALAEQADPDLDDPPMQYVDFSAWERQELTPERMKTLKQYWAVKLSDAPVFLERLCDRPLPEMPSDRGGYVHRQLDASVVQSVRQLAGHGDATHFVVLETSLAIVFSRLTDLEDIVIGTLTSGRRHPAFENCIGNFVNNILLRHRMSPKDTIVMSLAAAMADLASSLENDLLPFAEVAASITNGHNGSFRPAYEVFCQLIIEEQPHGSPPGSLEFTDIDITKPQPPQGEDLAITFIQSGDEIEARVGFLADQFDVSTIEALFDLYSAFIVQSAKSPDRSIDAVWQSCVEVLLDDNRSAALQRLLSRSLHAGGNPSGDSGASLSRH